MFGDCYKPTAYNEQIQDGKYTITLGKPTASQKGGYECVVIPISIQGHETALPKQWTMFDCRNKYDQEEVMIWNSRMTKFFDAFGIPYDEGGASIATWAGHVGQVYIGKDKNGYMTVKYPIITSGALPQSTPQTTPHKDESSQKLAESQQRMQETANAAIPAWRQKPNPYTPKKQPEVSDSPNMDDIPF